MLETKHRNNIAEYKDKWVTTESRKTMNYAKIIVEHTDQATRKIDELSMIQRQILSLRSARIHDVELLCRVQDSSVLQKELLRMGVSIQSVDEKDELFFEAALERASETFLGNARTDDQLFIMQGAVLCSVKSLQTLLQAKGSALRLCYDNFCGWPCRFSTKAVALMLEKKKRGISAFSTLNESSCIAVDDKGVLPFDEDRPWDEFPQIEELNDLRPEVRVRIARQVPFFGPGTKQLLNLIKQTGSIQKASQSMGLSYSKAWKMLSTLEDQLGYPSVESQQGGKEGGMTRLTKKGEIFLLQYERYVAECDAYASALFREFFCETEEGFVLFEENDCEERGE